MKTALTALKCHYWREMPLGWALNTLAAGITDVKSFYLFAACWLPLSPFSLVLAETAAAP
ncbi:hypothetical protein N5923_06570 [Erwiniaceae bacterium BAC15a-03b]|uniref:Uncharacterized protein n=1 Tax=Winslowiella arboricola TaxID=2978220 RepID=A0A9J6PL27_9GAMM|nr:hypothetical protein [Winslowiella arboricola]MCU5772851.1 hypothetical protein [Winslowiella arboricola]MCU5777155.1 hypothetical protein [Winslowiella arboricola]